MRTGLLGFCIGIVLATGLPLLAQWDNPVSPLYENPYLQRDLNRSVIRELQESNRLQRERNMIQQRRPC